MEALSFYFGQTGERKNEGQARSFRFMQPVFGVT